MGAKLAVGDRVRAYHSGISEKGTLLEFGPGGLWLVEADGILGGDKPSKYWYHPKQLRRLKVKPKAPKRDLERVERLLKSIPGQPDDHIPIPGKQFRPKKPGPIHLIEIREGESIAPKGTAVVTREGLAGAWDACDLDSRDSTDGGEMFRKFCAELGLPEQKESGNE